jgi:hypothetical protein
MISTAILAALLVAWLLHTRTLKNERARHEQRLDQLERAHTVQMQKLLAQKNPDLDQIIGLVDRLCQRVQAPSQAVVDHSVGLAPPSPPAVGFDDDEAFHAAREMSKEALADMLMDAEVAGVAS